MPWRVEHRDGPRPFKIVKNSTGEVVGSSKTMEEAHAAVRAMYAAEGAKYAHKKAPGKGKYK